PAPTAAVAAKYTPGTYEGSGSGMFGKVTMAVTFSEDKIVSIETVEKHETAKVTTPAFTILPQRIIEAQSLMVDTVSSATFASRAILKAVEEAASQATTDISSLKVALVKKPGETIQKTADVLVIGAGGAGLAAATSATQQGAKVIVLEKNEWAGGNTVASGGAWNAPDPEIAGKTPTKNGQLDTLKAFLDYKPEDYGPAADTLRTLQGQIKTYLAGDTTYMFDSAELYAMQTYIGGTRKDLDGKTIQGNFDLIKVLADNSLPTRNWVKEMGGVFSSELAEPSGALWTRTLVPDATKDPLGQVNTYVTNLEKVITAGGGELIYDTPATELIVENGAVKGAIGTMADGTKVEIRANATVMACGGFASNVDMVKKYDNYWGNLGDSIKYTTLPSTVGDGLVMAENAANAQLVGMDATQLNKGYKTTGLHAAEMGLHAIFVNKEGKRFVNEYAARDVYTKAALEQGGEYFCIMSEKNRKDKNGIFDTFVFDTVEEMANKFGMDPKVLGDQIDLYNSYVEKGEDPDFHKNVFGDKVESPYVISAWVPIIHHTMGGLKVNTNTEVLDKNDAVIPGLFAAGEVTGGLHGGNRLGGNAVADAFVFGKIAGKNASALK
ncbi:MAG: FAD-dependent oxidoreductase, partial [Pseudoflavonifractor sp.]